MKKDAFIQNVTFIDPTYLYILRSSEVIGFISPLGVFHGFGISYSEIEMIKFIAHNPRVAFSEMGKSCSTCMLCQRFLKNEVHKKNGFGPHCGKIWNLLSQDELLNIAILNEDADDVLSADDEEEIQEESKRKRKEPATSKVRKPKKG
jgi:hypothetical protein